MKELVYQEEEKKMKTVLDCVFDQKGVHFFTPDDTLHWCQICGDEIRGKDHYSVKGSNFGGPLFISHKECGIFPEEIKHPFHYHPLKISGNQSSRSCNMCNRSTNQFMYCCPGCDYRLDAKCASLTPGAPDSVSGSMVRCERCDIFQYFCDVCLRVIEGGVVYNDTTTKRLLHESCSNLPGVIDYPLHRLPLGTREPHQLTLVTHQHTSGGGTESFTCNACGRESSGYHYRCSDCEFSVDVNCAFLVRIDNIYYRTTHTHNLLKCKQTRGIVTLCSFCGQICKGSVYICFDCHFVMDESCKKLPWEIEHPFHPLHRLSLRARGDPALCNACNKYTGRFTYGCGNSCNIAVHTICAFPVPPTQNSFPLPPTLKSEHHSHPLVFLDKRNTYLICNICSQVITDPLICCLQCEYYLHLHCLPEFPQRVYHDKHGAHPLSLSNSSDTLHYCLVCKSETPADRCYRCLECPSPSIHAHTHCCLDQIKRHIETRGSTSAPENGHLHPLVYLNEPNTKFTCNFCSKGGTQRFWCCLQCDYYLHIHCFPELPRLVYHDKHSHHPLSLKAPSDNLSTYCDVCLESMGWGIEPTYTCEGCNFKVHIRCCMDQIVGHYETLKKLEALKNEGKTSSSMTDIIIVTTPAENGHLHPLVFLDKPNTNFTCNFCSKVINDPFCCCVQCEFYLHIHCLPELPRMVYHDRHKGHPLSLKDTAPEGRKCSVCSKYMSVLNSIYSCTNCKFHAHINCCMDQILKHYEILSKEALNKEDRKEDQGEDKKEDDQAEEGETKGSMAAIATTANQNQIAEANDTSPTEVPRDPGTDREIIIAELELEIARLNEKMEALRKAT